MSSTKPNCFVFETERMTNRQAPIAAALEILSYSPAIAWTADEASDHLASGTKYGATLITTDGGETPAGWAAWGPAIAMPAASQPAGTAADLYTFCVAPRFRRQGVAKQLIRETAVHCRRAGYSVLTASVFSGGGLSREIAASGLYDEKYAAATGAALRSAGMRCSGFFRGLPSGRGTSAARYAMRLAPLAETPPSETRS